MNCPDCGRDWSEGIKKPFKSLTCETCKEEKRRRIKLVVISRLSKRLAHQLDPEAVKKDIEGIDLDKVWG